MLVLMTLSTPGTRTEVYVQRLGKGVILLPVKDFWDSWILGLSNFSEDFMVEGREQPEHDDQRDGL